MQNKNRNDEKPKQRFSKEKFGDFIKKNYSTTKTAELANILQLTTDQVKEYARREKSEERSGQWAKKTPAHLSKIRSECGKMGGRPRKKS